MKHYFRLVRKRYTNFFLGRRYHCFWGLSPPSHACVYETYQIEHVLIKTEKVFLINTIPLTARPFGY